MLPVEENAGRALDHALRTLDHALRRDIAVVIHVEDEDRIAGVVRNIDFAALGIDSERGGPVELRLWAADHAEGRNITRRIARIDGNGSVQIPPSPRNGSFAFDGPVRLVRSTKTASTFSVISPRSPPPALRRLLRRGDGTKIGDKQQIAR